jgi:citrate lyase gamma subunit
MAKQNKITRKELEMLINEELDNLDEGMVDRFFAQLSGGKAAAGTWVANKAKGLINVGNRAFKSKEIELGDTKKIKQEAQVAKILSTHAKDIMNTINELEEDYKMLRSDAVTKGAPDKVDQIIVRILLNLKVEVAKLQNFSKGYKDAVEKLAPRDVTRAPSLDLKERK